MRSRAWVVVVVVAGVVALAPAHASAAKPRATGPKGMFAAGMTLGAIGLVSLVTGAVLWGVSNREANRVYELASPGPTGFPDRMWNEARPHALLRHRSWVAALTLLPLGTVAKAFAVPFTIRGAQRRWRNLAVQTMLPQPGLLVTFHF